MKEYEVKIETNGPSGNVVYQEGISSANFFWEFGGTDVLAIIHVGTPDEWEMETGFPAARREQILERLAAEVIKQKAPNCTYSLEREFLLIVEHQERTK